MNLKKYLDARIERVHSVISPEEMTKKIPAGAAEYAFIEEARSVIAAILDGRDTRFLLIVGPCSIHDTKAAFDYALRLSALQKKYADFFYIVMRSYFEKPRTSVGWRGLIVEPDLDGFINIGKGLERARSFLIKLAQLKLPAAAEMLDPIIPQYIADLVSWASIGARTSESQIHRELASGLSMPVGFKNATDGDVSAALNGIISARYPHAFLGVARNGLSAIMHTKGNPDVHLVLRGGTSAPNYDRDSVLNAAALLKKENLVPKIVIDCSHGNSQRIPSKQKDILLNSLALRFGGGASMECIRGCMLESFIQEGRTDIANCKDKNEYGRSVTDPCMGWEMTEALLEEAYTAFGTKQGGRTDMKLEIYTDGACSGNPGKGGWAYIILDKKGGAEVCRESGAEHSTTNNRMELSAVINALKKVRSVYAGENLSVSVHTDSQYVQQGIGSWIINWKKNGWKTASKQPVKNRALWVELDELNASLSPEWFWVKGHAGNRYNEECDRLAVKAVASLS